MVTKDTSSYPFPFAGSSLYLKIRHMPTIPHTRARMSQNIGNPFRKELCPSDANELNGHINLVRDSGGEATNQFKSLGLMEVLLHTPKVRYIANAEESGGETVELDADRLDLGGDGRVIAGRDLHFR